MYVIYVREHLCPSLQITLHCSFALLPIKKIRLLNCLKVGFHLTPCEQIDEFQAIPKNSRFSIYVTSPGYDRRLDFIPKDKRMLKPPPAYFM